MNAEAYFSANFGEQGGRYQWPTHEGITNWVNQLQNDWSWISGIGQPATNAAWQTTHQNIHPVISLLQQTLNYRAQNNLQNVETSLNAARSQLENFIRQFPWLLPNSAQRLFVEEIRDKVHKLEAGLLVAYWMKIDISNSPAQYIVNALLKWEFYERGIKDRLKTESAALKRLAGDMQTQATKFQEAEQTQTNRFDSLHGDITKQTGEQQQAFDEAQQQRTNTWEEQLNSTKQELENIKSTYD